MGKNQFQIRAEVARVVSDVAADVWGDLNGADAEETAELLLDRLEARGLKIVEAPR